MNITVLVSGNIRSNFSYRALALAQSLRKRGHAVSIIAPSADKYNDFIPEKITTINGVRILQPFQFKTKRPEINLIPYIISAASIVLREKSDLIYIYKPTPVSIVGLFAKLVRRTQLVLDMDDLGSEVMRIEGHPGYQRTLVAWCERLAARYADRIVAASTYLRDKYQKEFPEKPIHLMPNGVDATWFEPIQTAEKKKRVVFMGAINRRTILEPLFTVLPNVVRKYPDLTVSIIGSGTYLDYFKKKSKDLNLEKNVSFTGWLPIEQARTQLLAGDIGYNYMPDETTVKAASNMKTPQYMARGVVPLVSDVGDLASTVDFGNAGYISQPIESSLEAKLFEAFEDDEARLKKSEQARSFSAARFRWDILAAGFEAWLGPDALMDPPSADHKKIYVVNITVPGNVSGGEIRNYNLIKQLAKQPNASVELFCISPTNPEAARKNFEANVDARAHIVSATSMSLFSMTRAIFFEHVPPFMDDFRSSGVGDRLREACERSLPDAIHLAQIHAYFCIRPHLSWLKSMGVKIVLDCHNTEFQLFKDSLKFFSLPKRMIGEYLMPHIKDLEIEATRNADLILACSSSDAEYFKEYNPKTFVIPNGVDCSEFPATHDTTAPVLIFTGGVGYPPNADAMRFYLKEVHPIVKQEIPDVRLLAIGVAPEWLRSENITDASVTALGFVEAVQPYLREAAIGICPIRFGSGTRLKILTYMAAGLPVVSTSKGAEGIAYVNGRDILLRDEPAEFAAAIVELLKNSKLRDTIGQQGRVFVLQHYEWDIIGKQLQHLYHELT